MGKQTDGMLQRSAAPHSSGLSEIQVYPAVSHRTAAGISACGGKKHYVCFEIKAAFAAR